MARSKQLTRLEPWHHDLIRWMLQNPAAFQALTKDLGRAFGGGGRG